MCTFVRLVRAGFHNLLLRKWEAYLVPSSLLFAGVPMPGNIHMHTNPKLHTHTNTREKRSPHFQTQEDRRQSVHEKFSGSNLDQGIVDLELGLWAKELVIIVCSFPDMVLCMRVHAVNKPVISRDTCIGRLAWLCIRKANCRTETIGKNKQVITIQRSHHCRCMKRVRGQILCDHKWSRTSWEGAEPMFSPFPCFDLKKHGPEKKPEPFEPEFATHS